MFELKYMTRNLYYKGQMIEVVDIYTANPMYGTKALWQLGFTMQEEIIHEKQEPRVTKVSLLPQQRKGHYDDVYDNIKMHQLVNSTI